ncbi:hypothetical protein M2149_000356 [Lachnospiraceae bacterium PFB1-21]
MKTIYRIYIFFVVCILFIPLLGMPLYKQKGVPETEEKAKEPHVLDKGKINLKYLPELGMYFEDSYAFRDELITINGKLNTMLLRESPLHQVIQGKDGWLFYRETVKDFTGESKLSNESLAYIAHNLELMNRYAIANGAELIFVIAPNKNSIYPEKMPYYFLEDKSQSNAEELMVKLDERGINYVDCFTEFRKSDEQLYYKEDTHWNGKGAAIAYQEIMKKTKQMNVQTFDGISFDEVKNHSGDLAEMLYPTMVDLESDFVPVKKPEFVYTSDDTEPMSEWITTETPEKNGKLLFYRDSFGSALYPYLAGEFKQATISRFIPYDFGNVSKTSADVVVVEIAERNLEKLITEPAILPAAMKQPLEHNNVMLDSNIEIAVRDDGGYTIIEAYSNGMISEEESIYLKIIFSEGTEIMLEPLYLSKDKKNSTFRGYLNMELFTEQIKQVEVIKTTGDEVSLIGCTEE